MSRSSLLRSVMGAATVLSLTCGLTACGDDASDGAGSGDGDTSNVTAGKANPHAEIKKGMTIGFVPKQVSGAYFGLASQGGERALEQLGSSFVERGPDNATDTAGQISSIEELKQQQVEAMAVSAQSADALCDTLKDALGDGIKVVTYDSDTDPKCRNLFVSQAKADAIGWIQVELIAKQIDYKGEIAILSAGRDATNQNTWIKFMKEEIESAKYGDVRLVEIAYGDDEEEKSTAETKRLLEEHPNLKGIIAPTTVGIKAAAAYLSDSEYKGKVKVTGLGTPNDMRTYVKDGTVEEFALWDPEKLGELAARAAAALASGQITGKEGQLFLAGDMGWFDIEENGVVTLGEPTVFDKKNIDDYNF
ncbi:rhamnose ABC transporter substrate-binding protein [Streptomyces sp. NPDC086080]|uniref:rhamnose ABC transporter substrate-binding protein n=1 Tax=Streptomyces sp. NPDC086080 TaxID=3365748 RepID=UPI0037D42DD7